MRYNIFLIIILLLALPTYVLGVSVSPSKVRMGFEPDSFYEGVARFGSGGNTNHLSLGTWGDFNISLEKTDLYCDVEPCEVNYKVIMPKSFETPGLKRGYIVATEAYDEDPQGMMSVRVSITMPIYIDVPYPGKYLEWISLEAENVAAGNETKMTAKLVSRGTDTISEASGYVLIFDHEGKLVGSSGTNKVKNIMTDQQLVFATMWDSGINKQGNYNAFMRVSYDEGETNNSVPFKLGGLDVSMVNYSDVVYLGGIRPFFVTADSIWSEEIPSVRAVISIFNYSNSTEKPITTFETLTRSLPAWGTETMQGYVDTSILNVSVYDAKIKLYFADQSKDYDVKINFTLPPKIVEPKKKLEIFTTRNLLIALAIALVITLIVAIFAFIPKKKRDSEEKQAKQPPNQ